MLGKIYFSYGLLILNDCVLFVRKDAFLSSLAEDSDIWISLSWADFGGALLRLDLMSGVMPLMKRYEKGEKKCARPTEKERFHSKIGKSSVTQYLTSLRLPLCLAR